MATRTASASGAKSKSNVKIDATQQVKTKKKKSNGKHKNAGPKKPQQQSNRGTQRSANKHSKISQNSAQNKNKLDDKTDSNAQPFRSKKSRKRRKRHGKTKGSQPVSTQRSVNSKPAPNKPATSHVPISASIIANADRNHYVVMVKKRIRSVRKKFDKIERLEKAVRGGHAIDKEQSAMILKKSCVAATLLELEKLCKQLREQALHDEVRC